MTDLPGLSTCAACEFHKNGFVVSGSGPVPAKFMAIGEAPGRNENFEGRPFIGAAGKQFDSYLALAGISRFDVYVTNAVKHWPGEGNPTPKKDQIRACRPWLIEEVALVDPDVILVLGSTAIESLLTSSHECETCEGSGKVTVQLKTKTREKQCGACKGQGFIESYTHLPGLGSNHGLGRMMFVAGRERLIYPMYHPAAGMHRPDLKPVIEEDFRRLSERRVGPPQVLLAPAIDILTQTQRGPLAVDLETTSLDIETTDIVGLATADCATVSSYAADELPAYLMLLKHAIAEAPLIVMHNWGFDAPILERYGVTVPAHRIWDTMLSGYVLGKPSLKLKERVLREHNIRMTTFEEVTNGKKDVTAADPEALAAYGAADAAMTYLLYQHDKVEIRDNKAGEMLNIEHLLTPILRKMTRHGMLVDQGVLTELQADFEGRLAASAEHLFDLVGYRFNPDSDDDKRELLFDKLHLKPFKKTDGGKWSVDKETRTKLAGHPVVDALIAYEELTGLNATFVKGMWKHIKEDGRVHGEFNQAGARTGRFSSNKPNMQNIPSRGTDGHRIREIFVAAPGYVLVSLDYSQIELRVLAALSRDVNLVAAFTAGEDIHEKTRSILGDSADRTIAKMVNFGLPYGIQPSGLHRRLTTGGVQISRMDSDALHQRLLEDYEGAFRWIAERESEALDRGFAETLLHHRRYFPELRSSDPKLITDTMKEVISTIVQGTAANVAKAAIVQLKDYPLVSQIHDELIVEAPEHEAGGLANEIATVLRDVAEGYLNLPVKVGVGFGKSWGAIDKG